MPAENKVLRPSLSFDRLRRDIGDALGESSDLDAGVLQRSTEEVIRAVHGHRSDFASPLSFFADGSAKSASVAALDKAGQEQVALRVINPDGVYVEIKVNLAPDFIAAAKALADELMLDPLDAAGLLYSARAAATRRADRDVVAACRELFKLERRDQLLALQDLLRSPLSDEVGKAQIVDAFKRERDLLVVSNVLSNVLALLSNGMQLPLGRSTSNPKGLVAGEARLLAECVFLLAYTVQCSPAEAVAIRSTAERAAEVLHQVGGDAEPKTPGKVISESTQEPELRGVSHLLFLAWSCALDRSRYRDMYDPRTGSTDVNELLRREDFISESKKELRVSMAQYELVGCLFRLAGEHPDEETDAVAIPLRVCVGERKAIKYLSEDLPDWLTDGGAVLSSDVDLYVDAFEDLTIDLAEAPTICSVLIDFTQEATNASAASYSGASDMNGGGPSLPENGNFMAALAKMLASVMSLAKAKLAASRSLYGGLRYLSGANGGGGMMQKLGDSVIDLGDTAMRDPDAPGGVGRTFSDALLEFLHFMRVGARVSVPYAASMMRYLAEAGHPMASLERLQSALVYYTQALQNAKASELNPVEAKVLANLVSVVGNSAEQLHGHGDFMALLGKDFPLRIAALAVLEIPAALKAAAIDAVKSLRNAESVVALLESVAADKCAGLVKEINTVEAASGSYAVSIAFMQLCTAVLRDSVTFSPEAFAGDRELPTQFPAEIDVLLEYMLDQVVAFWGRRQFVSETERWSVAKAAVDALYAGRRSRRLISKLLMPAPGTGGPSSALRALAAIAGLRQGADVDQGPVGVEVVAKATASGHGFCAKLMEEAAAGACKLLRFLLDLPASQRRRASVTAVSAGELLLSEYRSVAAASTLIGSGGLASTAAASFVASTIAAAPELAAEITGDPAAKDLRASLATSIGAGEMDMEAAEGDGADEEQILVQVLRIISECLSRPKSLESGFMLLGISRDAPGAGDDYGILAALCERVRSASRLDDRTVATSATFLAELAGSSNGQISSAVLGFLRNSNFSSSALDALNRIFAEIGVDAVSGVSWADLGHVLAACMRIVALEARAYSFENLGPETVPEYGSLLLGLLRIVARVARDPKLQSLAIAAFGAWRQLFWTSASRFQSGGGSNTSTLYEIASRVLEGLDDRSESEMEPLMHAEGAAGACSVAMMSISMLREPSSEPSSVDLSQASSLLEKIVAALGGRLGSRPDGVTARMALYAAIVHVEQMIEAFAGEDSLQHAEKVLLGTKNGPRGVVDSVYARAFGGARLGRRQWSGAEAVVAVASGDAIAGSPAARSAAMNAISCVLRMETHGATSAGATITTLPMLAAQNRLRKIAAGAMSEPAVVDQISSIFTISNRAAPSPERSATLFVAESCLALLLAVANVSGGNRTLADAGAVDQAALLVAALSPGGDQGQALGANEAARASMLYAAEVAYGNGNPEELEQALEVRSSLGGSVARVAAASVRRRSGTMRPDSGVIAPCLAVIEAGQLMFAELLRNLRQASIAELDAATSVGLLLSRLVPDFGDVGGSAMLITLCARFTWALFQSKRERLWAGGKPKTARETHRARIVHPEGGSLFERDLALSRMDCARCCALAITGAPNLLSLFGPSLMASGDAAVVPIKVPLGDLVEVSRRVLNEMTLSAEEEMRISSNLTGVSRRLPQLRDFCQEEFGISGSRLNGSVLEKSMLKAAARSRYYAEKVCAPLLEALLFILCEYVRAAREAATGNGGKKHAMSQSDASQVLAGRNTLLSLCRDIDAIDAAVWGKKDPSFAKQMSRQIRTSLTER